MQEIRFNLIEPYLADDKHPYVYLRAQNFKLQALLDTGYAGGLSLPNRLKKHYQDAMSIPTRFSLGDGSIVTLEVFMLNLFLDDEYIGTSSVIFTPENNILIGIEFLVLLDKKLHIDWPNHQIELV